MTPLHWIGQFIRDGLQAIPLGAVRAAILLGLALLFLWVLKLPSSETTQVSERGRSADLRWGAALAILLQLVIYALL
ncbi:MAG: hypothetical protein KDA75_04265 [Planctomycetaceae bacterium]|nr:hypothetical protein [Planctomycetaceae bacterium]